MGPNSNAIQQIIILRKSKQFNIIVETLIQAFFQKNIILEFNGKSIIDKVFSEALNNMLPPIF